MKDDKGFALLETVLAIGLLGIVSLVFLGSINTSTKATMVSDERATAESLALSEIEYIKGYPYDYYATEYPVDPTLDIPSGWSLPNPTVEALHATDDGIQKITITVQRDGEDKLSILIYKVDR